MGGEPEGSAAKGAGRIPSLDGWRAIAAVLVVVGHADLLPGALTLFSVTFFFFLSGYLITTLMLDELERTGSLDVGKFLVRRLLRLTPPLVVTLGFAYLFAHLGWISGGTDPLGFASFLLYFHNYHHLAGSAPDSVPLGLGIYWSLAVEQHFYLVFPAIVLVFWRTGRFAWLPWFLACLCTMVLGWRAHLWIADQVDFGRVYYATDTRIDSILYGCILALWQRRAVRSPADMPIPLRNPWLAVGAVSLAVSFLVRDMGFRTVAQFTLQGLALMPLFLCSVRFPKHFLFAVLNHRFMVRLGELSYSVYLVHFVVILNIHRLVADRVAGLVLSVAITLAYALAMERFVERPLLAIRRRWR